MAQRASKPHLDAGQTPDAPELEHTEEARLDIERTRAHMGETLDHIGERLSPERFKAEAVDAVVKIKDEALDTAEHLKTAAVEAARAATHEVIDGVKQASWEAYDQARSRVLDTKDQIEGVSMTVINTMKRNPIPTAMVGFGLYWLYQSLEENRVRGGRSRRPAGKYESWDERQHRLNEGHSEIREKAAQAADMVDRVKDKIVGAAGQAREKISDGADTLTHKAGEFGDVVHDQGQRAVDEFQHIVHTSPLIVGGVAAAVGLAFGMMLPDTEVENRAMGGTRDEWVDQAQVTVSEAVGEIKDKAIDLKDKAVQVAGTTATAVVESVMDTVKEAAEKQPFASGTAPQKNGNVG